MVFGEPNYGSDQHGLVWAYLIVPGEPAEETDSDGALTWLAAEGTGRGESFLWLHFSLSNTASERWMRKRLDLPDSFYESLTEKAVSTRLETGRQRLGRDDQRCQFRLHGRFLQRVIGEHFASSRACWSARVDLIEDKVLANQLTPSRRELGSLRRVLVRLQRLLAPEPAALFRLLNRPPVWIGGEDLQDLRQAGEEFSAAVADSAALAERVKLLQEEFAALTNEQTSRTLFILTLVTVLALPINLIAGLFGMNVGGIPLAEHRHGFALIIGFLAVITGVLGYIGLRNRGE